MNIWCSYCEKIGALIFARPLCMNVYLTHCHTQPITAVTPERTEVLFWRKLKSAEQFRRNKRRAVCSMHIVKWHRLFMGENCAASYSTLI